MLRVISFVRTMWLAIRYGEAWLHVQRGRLIICQSCPEMASTSSGLYCKACQCPQWFMSDIRTKTRIRRLACPQGRW